MSRKFELRSVFVAELAADRRDAADSEIRKVVGLFEQRAGDLGLVHAVELDVVLAEEMGAHVDRVQKSYGAWGGSAYSGRRSIVGAKG